MALIEDLAVDLAGLEDRLGAGAVGSGEWLVAYHRLLDSSAAGWLEALARFDVDEGWVADGQLSCVDWLMARAGMARATAFEKLRVARQLAVRPALAEALRSGRVSYCAVRAMTKALDPTLDVDEAFVAVAEAGTVADVEQAVRAYLLYQSQERPPHERRAPQRGLRVKRLPDGMAKVEVIVSEVEAAELEAALRLTMERSGILEVDQSTRADQSGATDQSTRADSVARPDADRSWPELRADGLMELVRGGLGEWSPGADRYMAHLVVRDGVCSALGQGPVEPAEAARILCDCSHVTHVEDGHGAPLALGRRQRVWSSGQRRAVVVRDGGHCRWPGCRRTRVDIHHLVAWEQGGSTDVDNGLALCPRHHHTLHAGFFTDGTANGALTFHRRDGTAVGTSTLLPRVSRGRRPGGGDRRR